MTVVAPETLGELLAFLVHDLRNPLSALRTNLGFLGSLESNEPDSMKEALDDGIASCDGLAAMIDNIDLIGRALRGGLAESASPIRLAPALQDVCARTRIAGASHEVKVALAPEARTTLVSVRVSQPLLLATLDNLVRNGIQLAPPRTTVRISLEVDARAAAVLIEDDGPPLAEEHRTAVFTAEGQLRLKGHPGGRYSRALGLWCARLAADAIGAELAGIPSPSERGNAFRLALPLA
jgi:signal transduction histidine kinase